ncbi:MAG: hypothetical protein HOW73_26120 [Polyangiaceae bacterium]|nr:hypothetical protein [Polyangiaceae bacterium]
MKRLLRPALSLFLFASFGCDPKPTQVPTSTPPTATASGDGRIEDPGVFNSKRFGMKLRLPRSATWKIDDTTNRWLVATQRAESSTLVVRLWRDENRMNRDKCEALARSFRPLPSREGAEMLSEQLLDVPPGFDTRAEIGVTTDSKGGIFGFVLGFGGYGRKCFAYVYVTRAEGPQADAIVADRLAEMVEGSLTKLTFESDLEAVLERDVAPP